MIGSLDSIGATDIPEEGRKKGSTLISGRHLGRSETLFRLIVQILTVYPIGGVLNRITEAPILLVGLFSLVSLLV